jgi:hypothetical protein
VQTYDGMVIGEHSRETDLEVSPPISILDILFMGTYGYLALHYFRKKGNHHFMNLVSLMQLCPFHVLGLSICGF